MKVLPIIRYGRVVKRQVLNGICVLIIGMTLASCGHSSVEVSIVNASANDLTAIEVSNSRNEISTGLFDLKAGDKASKQLSFSTVSPSDGHYVLRMKDHLPRDFGYYSNGIPSAGKIAIEVRADTVLIQME